VGERRRRIEDGPHAPASYEDSSPGTSSGEQTATPVKLLLSARATSLHSVSQSLLITLGRLGERSVYSSGSPKGLEGLEERVGRASSSAKGFEERREGGVEGVTTTTSLVAAVPSSSSNGLLDVLESMPRLGGLGGTSFESTTTSSMGLPASMLPNCLEPRSRAQGARRRVTADVGRSYRRTPCAHSLSKLSSLSSGHLPAFLMFHEDWRRLTIIPGESTSNGYSQIG
jgi:hypothetical protein